MLSDEEKEEMLSDAYSQKRREEFLKGERQKRPTCRSLNDYMVFLAQVQKIRPFAHRKVITPTQHNLL